MNYAFTVVSRNLCVTQSHHEFLYFLLEVFFFNVVLGFTFKSTIYFELIVCIVWGRVQG